MENSIAEKQRSIAPAFEQTSNQAKKMTVAIYPCTWPALNIGFYPCRTSVKLVGCWIKGEKYLITDSRHKISAAYTSRIHIPCIHHTIVNQRGKALTLKSDIGLLPSFGLRRWYLIRLDPEGRRVKSRVRVRRGGHSVNTCLAVNCKSRHYNSGHSHKKDARLKWFNNGCAFVWTFDRDRKRC